MTPDEQWDAIVDNINLKMKGLKSKEAMDAERESYIYLLSSGMISQREFLSKRQTFEDEHQKRIDIIGELYEALKGRTAGEDPLIWKLSRT